MSELTNAQLTQLLVSQSEILNNINKKLMTKTKLKDIKPNITIEEFIENIEILSPTKLLSMSLPEYYAYIILHNIEKLDEKNIPIVCANPKIKKFYYFSNGQWIVSKDITQKIRNVIFKLVCGELIKRKNEGFSEENCLCISHFFDVEKYPNHKLVEKMMIELGKIIHKTDDIDSD